jgi:hypothetical protein
MDFTQCPSIPLLGMQGGGREFVCSATAAGAREAGRGREGEEAGEAGGRCGSLSLRPPHSSDCQPLRLLLASLLNLLLLRSGYYLHGKGQ